MNLIFRHVLERRLERRHPVYSLSVADRAPRGLIVVIGKIGRRMKLQ